MRLFLLSITLSPAICLAFLWPSKINSVIVKTLSIAHSNGRALDYDIVESLTEKEIESLRINYDALQSYSRKPDCFKRAASLIRTRCTELDMDEDGRVNAAIMMTLCEVATAKHHSLPLECHPYLYDDGKKDKNGMSAKVQGECVDSLARSAQFWSSYSGYLREVPQLCHAFRRWNDIDLAKDIYRNATMENMALLRFIVGREKMISKHTDKWTDISSEMERLVHNMKALSERYQMDTDQFALGLKEDADDVVQSFRTMAHNILARQEEWNTQSASQFQVVLSEITQTHSEDLTILVDSVNSLFSSRLERVLSLHEARYWQLDHDLSIMQERWATLGDNFDGMKESVFRLSDHTAQLSHDLKATVRDARNIHILQAEASVTASDLVKTLNHLTETANLGLDKINNSAHLIGQHLQTHIEKAGRTWVNWPIQLLGVIFRADPESFGYLEQRLSFRLLSSFLGFSWTAFRTVASMVSTISVVLLFATSRVFIQKSATVLSSVWHHSTTSALPSSELESKFNQDAALAIGQTIASPMDQPIRDMMPTNIHLLASSRDFKDDRYRQRVSWIPGRLWKAPTK